MVQKMRASVFSEAKIVEGVSDTERYLINPLQIGSEKILFLISLVKCLLLN